MSGHGAPRQKLDEAVVFRNKIGEILCRHFSEEASFDPNIPIVMTALIRKAIATGRPPIWGEIRVDPDRARFRDALFALKDELPAQIEGHESTLAAFLAAGNTEQAKRFEPAVYALRALAQAVDAEAKWCSPARRKPDVRSDWQPSARAFANLIKWGFQSQAGPRLRQKALSCAVQDLLRLSGIKNVPNLPTIAKALTNIPSSKDDSTLPGALRKNLRQKIS